MLEHREKEGFSRLDFEVAREARTLQKLLTPAPELTIFFGLEPQPTNLSKLHLCLKYKNIFTVEKQAIQFPLQPLYVVQRATSDDVSTSNPTMQQNRDKTNNMVRRLCGGGYTTLSLLNRAGRW